ncbi:hypothetical protein K1T71_008363 [Dendrolimus kikuchii]|uniref:Uncharacterized protein n=1 Tax=Dendrolimus kikuchii TaxID=765133 RepID=A0ACC1CWT5_9NEOP|nr:hypothetical protein K1T71_008363 [Dendrolimus kikuchii]
MKYFVILLVVCVAMAAAAPQIIAAFPGYAAAAVAPYPASTLVAGPTVVNGVAGRYVYPGYVGPAVF